MHCNACAGLPRRSSSGILRYEIRQLQAFRAAGKIHETAAQLEKLRAEQQQSVEIGAVDLVVVTIAQRPDNTVRAAEPYYPQPQCT